jgi:hypothetical protein
MAGRGQKRGGNANAQRQSLSSSGAGSSPSISSANATASVAAVSRAAYDPAVARRQASEKKYPLWKYVTKKQGQGSVSKASGGGNVTWNCNFSTVSTQVPTTGLKAIYWPFLVDLDHVK